MKTNWTDDRLDDLNRHVEEGFRRVDGDLRALRIETKTELVSLRGEMNSRFDRMNDRFDSLQRTMVWLFGSLSVSLVGLIASIVISGA